MSLRRLSEEPNAPKRATPMPSLAGISLNDVMSAPLRGGGSVSRAFAGPAVGSVAPLCPQHLPKSSNPSSTHQFPTDRNSSADSRGLLEPGLEGRTAMVGVNGPGGRNVRKRWGAPAGNESGPVRGRDAEREHRLARSQKNKNHERTRTLAVRALGATFREKRVAAARSLRGRFARGGARTGRLRLAAAGAAGPGAGPGAVRGAA